MNALWKTMLKFPVCLSSNSSFSAFSLQLLFVFENIHIIETSESIESFITCTNSPSPLDMAVNLLTKAEYSSLVCLRKRVFIPIQNLQLFDLWPRNTYSVFPYSLPNEFPVILSTSVCLCTGTNAVTGDFCVERFCSSLLA